ncbi:CIA30 family protein [Acidobacteriota bacterium]
MRSHFLSHSTKHRAVKILIILCLTLISSDLQPSVETSQTTVIKDVRIFDGVEIIPFGMVLLKDGIISQVGKDVKIPDGALIIDGKGHTLLPGFFDCHAHVWTAQNLQQSLIFGVTTVVDMFMDIKAMAEMKKNQLGGKLEDAAYLISPGNIVTAPGGHGTQYGMPIPTIDNPTDALDFVDARIAEGSDFIKILWDDGSAYNRTIPALDFETVKAVIEAAHKRGKMAIIHAATLQQCRQAMEAGVDGLAHLFFTNDSDPDFGRLAAKQNTFVIPTLTIVLGGDFGAKKGTGISKDPHLVPNLMPNDFIMLESTFSFSSEDGSYQAAQKALKQLRQEKVPILAGTDAPNPGTTYGASLHHELELLVESGLTPIEALRSATSIPAGIFKLNDRGRIKSGHLADLVMVEGNPTQDIKDSRRIVRVWRAGVDVDLSKYRKSVENAKEQIEKQREAPPPENFGSGWISDFEGEKITSNFGAGWSVSTDALMGGKSKAEYQLIKEGAQGSTGSLMIFGTVDDTGTTPWAGAFFSPGQVMMSPTNLSSKKSIRFWARGDEKSFSVMIFAQNMGFMPATLTFDAGPEWKEYEFTFKDFGIEGFDIGGIFIGAENPGAFKLQIDNVHLK